MAQLIKDEDVTLVVQSLVGSIPSTDISLENFREERLRKYEAVDCCPIDEGRLLPVCCDVR